MDNIKILGPGCPKCDKTAKIVEQAVRETGIDAQLEKITDIAEIAGFGVMATPAVVVNGDVKCAGKIPGKEDVILWLKE